MSSRRRREVSPLIGAGLIRFPEGKEIEKIKLSPIAVIVISLLIIVLIVIAHIVAP